MTPEPDLLREKESRMSAELHLVFGAGQVGLPLAQRLVEAGKRVRIAKRSPRGAVAGIEIVQDSVRQGQAQPGR